MKKQDILIIAILFAMMMAWPFIYKSWIEPRIAPARPAPAAPAMATASVPEKAAPAAETRAVPVAAPVEPPAEKTEVAEEPSPAAGPETVTTLSRNSFSVTVSSRGAAITAAEFANYRAAIGKDSGPVRLDFSRKPALAYRDLRGFGVGDNFTVLSSAPDKIVLQAVDRRGVQLTRTLELDDLNRVLATDVFTNLSAEAHAVPAHSIAVGPMVMPAGDYRMSGMNYLGIDALAASGGEGVIYWADRLAKLFKTDAKENNRPYLAKAVSKLEKVPVDWVAAKNKFFVQILAPEGGASAYRVEAERTVVEREDENPDLKPRKAEIAEVSAVVLLDEKTLAAGQSFTQVYRLYLGPKKYAVLHRLGLHQEDVMEFGMWSPLCKILLVVLNKTHDFIPNYGVAIIILTILIRIIFWPLTHKGTESMKRMQELQPLMAALKAKYKDNPRKMQEETMALYRKHKINPVSGCLPMLIQIPVFIALFVVLRSAIELRFAPFLWIGDLSAPERLLAGVLPIPLNILPIFMALSQAWQQVLMPTPDPNQQKMMVFFMPALMLVMFYMMPSALVLYWSANQVIVIVQQLIQKARRKTAQVGTAK